MERVFDEGADLRRYRIELPNLIDDFDLTPYAFRLYVHLKRRAGASQAGRCFEGTRALAASCRMSVGKTSQAKQELVAAGLVVIEPGNPAQNRPDSVRIVNLWAQNFAHYAPANPAPTEAPDPRSPGEHPVHGVNTPRSPREHPVHDMNALLLKKEPSKKEPREEECVSDVSAIRSSGGAAPKPPTQNSQPTGSGGRKTARKPQSVALPENWVPDQATLEYAQRFAGMDVEAQAELFRQKALAKAWEYVNWQAAFRTFLNHASQWGYGVAQTGPVANSGHSGSGGGNLPGAGRLPTQTPKSGGVRPSIYDALNDMGATVQGQPPTGAQSQPGMEKISDSDVIEAEFSTEEESYFDEQ